MKRNGSIILALIISLFFVQCKKEKAVTPVDIKTIDLGQIHLTDEQLNIVPYKKDDVIFFKNATGDSMKFTIDSRASHFPRMYENGGTDANTSFYDFEENTTVFADECGRRFNITLDAALPASFLPMGEGKNMMTLQFGLPDCKLPTVSTYSKAFLVDPTNFYDLNGGSDIALHDSLNWMNKKFYSVFEFKNISAPPDNAAYDYIASMYYSKSKGIVGFETKKGSKWCLQ